MYMITAWIEGRVAFYYVIKVREVALLAWEYLYVCMVAYGPVDFFVQETSTWLPI